MQDIFLITKDFYPDGTLKTESHYCLNLVLSAVENLKKEEKGEQLFLFNKKNNLQITKEKNLIKKHYDNRRNRLIKAVFDLFNEKKEKLSSLEPCCFSKNLFYESFAKMEQEEKTMSFKDGVARTLAYILERTPIFIKKDQKDYIFCFNEKTIKTLDDFSLFEEMCIESIKKLQKERKEKNLLKKIITKQE